MRRSDRDAEFTAFVTAQRSAAGPDGPPAGRRRRRAGRGPRADDADPGVRRAGRRSDAPATRSATPDRASRTPSSTSTGARTVGSETPDAADLRTDRSRRRPDLARERARRARRRWRRGSAPSSCSGTGSTSTSPRPPGCSAARPAPSSPERQGARRRSRTALVDPATTQPGAPHERPHRPRSTAPLTRPALAADAPTTSTRAAAPQTRRRRAAAPWSRSRAAGDVGVGVARRHSRWQAQRRQTPTRSAGSGITFARQRDRGRPVTPSTDSRAAGRSRAPIRRAVTIAPSASPTRSPRPSSASWWSSRQQPGHREGRRTRRP